LSKAYALLTNFSPNYEKLTYELPLAGNALPARYNATIQLLLGLRVLRIEDEKLMVDSRYVVHARNVLANRRGTSEEELARALLAQRKLGEQAEIAVLEYERRRLASLGRADDARLARRISQLDVGAGYDIESFDGAGASFDYDRFIEVKASYEDRLRFHFTENEYRVAKRLGQRYWIYFVGDFRQNSADLVRPIMIRDPANRLQQMEQLSIQPADYLITQRASLQLRAAGGDVCPGFDL
jgi:hypothetical protein